VNASSTEFQINSHTSDSQEKPAITYLSDGGFVVVWKSRSQDGDTWGIYGQRYNSLGNKEGTEFQVNSHTANEQIDASVTGLKGGGFVVTWVSPQEGSHNIYSQQFDGAGGAVNKEFRINTDINSNQIGSCVIGLNEGGFLVVWESVGQDGYGRGIYAQRYHENASTLGSQFQVNTETSGDQRDPSLTELSNGDLVFIWTSNTQGNNDIHGQRYDNMGNVADAEILINT